MLEVLAAVFGLSLLVIVHELGHYWVARQFGIRVTHFTLGFGPVVAKYRPPGSGTTFQLCAIPVMGSVTIAGMNPAESIAPNDPTLYPNKSLFARTATILGGPLANYLTAVVLLFGLALSGLHESRPSEPMTVDSVHAGSPAAQAGIRAGDVILAVEGQAIRNVSELTEQVRSRSGEPTNFLVQREAGPPLSLDIVPSKLNGRWVIGVNAKVEAVTRTVSVAEAAKIAVTTPWVLTAGQVAGIAHMISARTSEGLMGPVGMGKLVAQQADKSAFDFVGILIVVSIGLGFMNLLPLPFLDGGRLLFLAYEFVTRRKPNRQLEAVVHAVGMLALLALIALITLRDVIG
jgi:regulator of sigma E protease